IRAIETDPKKYYPPEVYREPVRKYAGPTGVIDLEKMMKGGPPGGDAGIPIHPQFMLRQKLDERLEGRLKDVLDGVGDEKVKAGLKERLRTVLRELID